MIDLILSHVIRSICIIIIGTACNIAVIVFDVNRHGAITGLSLVGIVAVCAVAAVAFVNQQKLDRFIHLARFRRNRNQGGAVLAVILPVAFVLGVIAGQVAAGGGEPSSFWLMLVGLAMLAAFVARSRRPRRNRKTRPGCVKRWLAWRQVRKAARSVRLVEVNR